MATTPNAAAKLLGVEVADEDSVNGALALLLTTPDTDDFVRGDDFAPGKVRDLEYRVPRTRLFVNVERLKDVRGDALAALAVWLISNSPTWAAAVAALRKVASAIRLMTADEANIYEAVLRETTSASRSVSTGRLIKSSGIRRRQLEVLLDAMVVKGLVERDRDGWQVAK